MSKIRVRSIATAFFVIILAFLLFGYYLESSRYIPINIPSPLSNLPNGDWNEIHYITKYFVDEYGKILILRKDGLAYGTYKGYTFDTPENVLSYFHDYFENMGWVPSDSSPKNSCQYGLPEKDYIDDLSYEEYMKAKDDPVNANEKICVAVIKRQRYSWEDHAVFKVVVISSKYSPITEFLEELRK